MSDWWTMPYLRVFPAYVGHLVLCFLCGPVLCKGQWTHSPWHYYIYISSIGFELRLQNPKVVYDLSLICIYIYIDISQSFILVVIFVQVLHLSQQSRASIMNSNPLISFVSASLRSIRSMSLTNKSCAPGASFYVCNGSLDPSSSGHAAFHWLRASLGLCLHGRVHCECSMAWDASRARNIRNSGR